MQTSKTIFSETCTHTLTHSHTHTPVEVEPSHVDPSLHQPDTQLLDKLKDVYVESTTNVITVSISRQTSAKLVGLCSLDWLAVVAGRAGIVIKELSYEHA